VPHERVNLRPNRQIRHEDSISSAVEDELRRSQMLGADDALRPRTLARQLAGKTQARFQQVHKGVPVFAAEIVVSVDGEKMISILGHTSPEIDVDPAPTNDYSRTIALARRATQSTIEILNDGSLVILAVEGGHRVGWLGLVRVDSAEERVILDAETGEILFREPTKIG